MRKPLLANASVTITHCIRQGTSSNSYTVMLSGVSCREVSCVRTGSGNGFAPNSTTQICIFAGHTTIAPQSGTGAPVDAASTFSPRWHSKPQRTRSASPVGRWHQRTRCNYPADAPAL